MPTFDRRRAAGPQGGALRALLLVLVFCPAARQPASATEPTTHDWLLSRAGMGIGPPGGEVRCLIMAPGRESILYASTPGGRIHVSTDRAASWRLLPTALPDDAIVDNLAFDPRNEDVVYAAYWRPDDTGGLIRSRDQGKSWTEVDIPLRPSLRALQLPPSEPGVILAGGIGGFWRSDDEGASWRFAGPKQGLNHAVESIAAHPYIKDVIYAGTWQQPYMSTNGGATFRCIGNGMNVDRDVFTIAIRPDDADRMMVGTCNFAYVSDDGGQHWREVKEGIPADRRRIHTLVYDPACSDVLYAGTRGGLYVSRHGGSSWAQLLEGVSVTSIVVDSSHRIYLGTEERGVLYSDDGLAFREANNGIDESRVVAFDALSGAFSYLFAAVTRQPGAQAVLMSRDGGRGWEQVTARSFFPGVRFLRVRNQPYTELIMVTSEGWWWSEKPGTGGERLEPPPGSVNALRVAHGVGGLLLTGTDAGLFLERPDAGGSGRRVPEDESMWRRLSGGPITALEVDGDLFVAVGPDITVTGRLSRILLGKGQAKVVPSVGIEGKVTDVALGTEEDGRPVYAITGPKIYGSTTAGRTWEELPLPWSHVELVDIESDPAHPGDLLALDYRGALYRGHGKGRHWLSLDSGSGLRQATGFRLSKQVPDLVLVSTEGRGLRVVPRGVSAQPFGETAGREIAASSPGRVALDGAGHSGSAVLGP